MAIFGSGAPCGSHDPRNRRYAQEKARHEIAEGFVAVALQAGASPAQVGHSFDDDAPIELEPKGGLELLVLEGGFREAGESFAPQSWLRLPVGTPLRARAGRAGCRIWVKEGHLRHVRAPENL